MARQPVLDARRAPMGAAARASFLAEYGIGIGLLVTAYVFATALRDFRDNFAAELWSGLGYGDAAAIFTTSELPVAILALSTLGFIITVRDNTQALMVIHAVIVAGLALLGGSTLAFQAGWLGSCTLLIWLNFGLMQLNWLQVFTASAYGTSILGMVLVGLSAVYFLRKAAAVNP